MKLKFLVSYNKSMKIVLVRHGETDWNLEERLMGQRDIPLNERGREQAMVLKEKLANLDFDCCYTSPLSRAKETAEIICDGKCPIICDDNLKERYGGKFEGKIINNWGDCINDESSESDAEILWRARNFLEKLKDTNYKKILVVSHNGLLKNLRHCILGKDGAVDYEKGNFSNCDFEEYEFGIMKI